MALHCIAFQTGRLRIERLTAEIEGLADFGIAKPVEAVGCVRGVRVCGLVVVVIVIVVVAWLADIGGVWQRRTDLLALR